jgi:hypothetical protein
VRSRGATRAGPEDATEREESLETDGNSYSCRILLESSGDGGGATRGDEESQERGDERVGERVRVRVGGPMCIYR